MSEIEELQARCICPMCPSFVKCDEPIAYCLPDIKTSTCIASKSGCICPGCPVYEQLKLDRDYYCISKL
ncbi:MAG: DUF2769 domain-containing protein [Actinobacteria bacterium]|nr:DUF2769 domain-containing protein [Actinomycetota bacterium]